MRHPKLIAITLLVASVVGLFIVFPQISIYILTKWKFSKERFPGVYTTLIERTIPIQNLSNAGYPFSYEGLGFRVPFELVNDKTNENVVWLEFHQDKAVAMFKPDQNKLQPLVAFLGENSKDKEALQYLFGKEAIENTYNLHKLMLKTHPNQISLFMSEKEALAKFILLNLKAVSIIAIGKEGIIYNFYNNTIRGFQYGDPARNETSTHGELVRLFKENDKTYEILFRNFTQDEIDSTLSSITLN